MNPYTDQMWKIVASTELDEYDSLGLDNSFTNAYVITSVQVLKHRMQVCYLRPPEDRVDCPSMGRSFTRQVPSLPYAGTAQQNITILPT